MKTVTTKAQLLLHQTPANLAKYATLLRGPYSQRELSLVLHVKQQSISDWEAGLARPMARQFRGLLLHFLDWYETQRIEYTAAIALTLLPIKKPLTPPRRPDIPHTTPRNPARSTRTRRRT